MPRLLIWNEPFTAMTFLVDTHVLLWWLTANRKLSRRSRDLISDPENRVLTSAVCAWEIAIKKSLGKLAAPSGLLEVVEASGLEWIHVSPREAYAAGHLPMHHRDPFDRLLIAQAADRSMAIISHDSVFDGYGVRRAWN